MATIVDEHNNLDLLSLTRALQKSLPPFARPVFIRLTHAVDTTGIEIYLFNHDITFSKNVFQLKTSFWAKSRQPY
jgi:hypothetical protein